MPKTFRRSRAGVRHGRSRQQAGETRHASVVSSTTRVIDTRSARERWACWRSLAYVFCPLRGAEERRHVARLHAGHDRGATHHLSRLVRRTAPHVRLGRRGGGLAFGARVFRAGAAAGHHASLRIPVRMERAYRRVRVARARGVERVLGHLRVREISDAHRQASAATSRARSSSRKSIQLDGRALRVAAVLPRGRARPGGGHHPSHAGRRQHLGDAARLRRIHAAHARHGGRGLASRDQPGPARAHRSARGPARRSGRQHRDHARCTRCSTSWRARRR